MRKRSLAVLLAVLMIIGLVPQNPIIAQADGSQSVKVNITKKLDVALAVGNTDVDYSNFAEDLKAALLAKGNVAASDVSVSELEATSVGTSSSFAWWVYDHAYNTSNINEANHQYVEQTAVSGNNNGHAYYTLPNHIVVTNNGADLGFRGYGASGYKDFMYLENNDPTKKTFQFDIQENEAYDALDGVGFLFNTKMTGSYSGGTQKMTGYLLFLQYNGSGKGQEIDLYKFTDVNTKSFHDGGISYPLIASSSGFTKLASSNVYNATDTYRKIRIQVQPTKVKVWYMGSTSDITGSNAALSDSDLVSWTVGSSTTASEVGITSTGAYGFGPLGSYRSHGCTRLTSIDLKNLTMSTEEAKTLTEVVREPDWRDNTERFIVNLNEDTIGDFANKDTMSEVISRLDSQNISYIGWGSDTNKDQTEDFLALDGNKGCFVNTDSTDADSDTYSKQIDKIADYILQNYSKTSSDDTVTVLSTDKVSLTVEGAPTQDTEDSQWPEGKWKIVHDTTGFDQVNGVYQYSGQYRGDLDTDFTLPGRYEIYYENTLVKTVIVNTRPVALFDVQVTTGSAIVVSPSSITVSGAAITYNNTSYDPDDSNGIDTSKTVWKYMKVSGTNTDSTWQVGVPDLIADGDVYLVSLIVTDKNGTESLPYTRRVGYAETGTKSKPYADFELSTSQLVNGSSDSSVTITDKSYDVYGASITYNYTVTKDGVSYSKTLVPGINDFSGDGAGTYKISLTVTSENGTSEQVARTLTITSDTAAPTVSCSVANGTTTGYNKLVLNYSDTGSSGFKYQKAALTTGSTFPEDGDSAWTESSDLTKRTVYMTQDGTYYLHYKASDNAGNEISGTFGPFTYEGNVPYVSSIISPAANATGQPVNTAISFQMSEKVVKGDGYITVYNKNTGKKYLEVHSSNNRVKISGSGLVTVELPKVFEYNTAYYVVVGSNFVVDTSNKPMAQFGGADEWSFQTEGNGTSQTEDTINITSCKVTQDGYTPFVNVDQDNAKTYLVYVQDGIFTLLPNFSGTTDQITVTGNDCTASLSNDKKSITVSFANNAADPYIMVTIGSGNTYKFKIVQTNKTLGASIDNTVESISVQSDDAGLLNAVNLEEDMNDPDVEKIQIFLRIQAPQDQTQQAAVESYVGSNYTPNHTQLFDAVLIKTITTSAKATTGSSITNTQEPIVILINIPSEYQSNYSYTIIRYHNGQIEELPVSVVNGGTQLSFSTDRFSTYAVLYTKAKDNSTPIVDNDTDTDSKGGYQNNTVITGNKDAQKDTQETTQTKPLSVPSNVKVTEGQETQLDIENLPAGATVRYHITTPTVISIDSKGMIFGKKAGNGIILASISNGGTVKSYKILVKINKSKEKGTSVGFIQYYDQLFAYNNIMYRVTKEATGTEAGTVAVGNNQTNEKLPLNIVIPKAITVNGKKYEVTSIDESAFFDLRNIKSVSIPQTVTNISSTAFVECISLTHFTVSKSNPNYSAKNGMLLNKDGTKLLAYPSATGKITIDKKITVIGAYAINAGRKLTQVTIPATVKVIEGCAFAHSKSLKKVYFQGAVPTVNFPSVFDYINDNAVVYVKTKYLASYKKAFKNAMQPSGVVFRAE